MEKERFDGGFAVLGQAMLLLFFIPFILLVICVVSKNISLEGIAFIACISGMTFLILRNAFSYADIYLSGDCIILKKIFKVKKKPISEYKRIDSALIPFTYCIEFEDNEKVYFFLRFSMLFRDLVSSEPDRVLKELRVKFIQLKEATN